MKNSYAISDISHQLMKVCERIDTLSQGIEMLEEHDNDALDVYVDQRLDELEHAQILVLKMTELISDEISEDTATDGDEGSVFAAGDLDTVKGEEDDE